MSDKFTVDEFCGNVTIQFQDVDFFNKVKHALIDHYPVLRRQMTSPTGHEPQHITDQCGHDVRLTSDDVGNDVIHDVSLSVSDDARSLVARDDGAMSWAMRDFPLICRNIAGIGQTFFFRLVYGNTYNSAELTRGS